ncbi:peptidase M28 [Chthoniobacter flavus Ellin428]|uniref:Peptidase M28 n=1 Tax=Chthoniobacter flavus Ellin428 TaxID=497964 RepID=B4CYR3_9BACT|nr:M28 family peptidase [Chthoniobacter flavus]EDY20604.1 peptidase M28 [Chthoniobacter flavus Ellin428]TCO89889.1 peptidase M28-like protein [Chthoniobacter flavus]
MVRFRCLTLAVAVVAALSACKPAPKAAEGTAPVEQESERPAAISVIKSNGGAPASHSVAAVPPPAEIWKEFSGDKAFAEARAQVEVGPRPAGTPELEKARVLIEEALHKSGWDAERQTFTADTPHGPTQFVNIIARFSATGAHPAPRNTQRAIVCSHYDTKRFSTIKFVGASDGASSTGALLELARVLALDPAMAAQLELVFFDGEEAFVQFTDPDDPKPDGLYGSRYYARTLMSEGRASQFKFGILWDMIGDRDLTITLPPDSPKDLASGILSSAEALGVRQNFGYFSRTILDDHVELQHRARIPSVDLIDFDYIYWHTAGDTLEHIAPESLQKVGAVTLCYLRQALAK